MVRWCWLGKVDIRSYAPIRVLFTHDNAVSGTNVEVSSNASPLVRKAVHYWLLIYSFILKCTSLTYSHAFQQQIMLVRCTTLTGTSFHNQTYHVEWNNTYLYWSIAFFILLCMNYIHISILWLPTITFSKLLAFSNMKLRWINIWKIYQQPHSTF